LVTKILNKEVKFRIVKIFFIILSSFKVDEEVIKDFPHNALKVLIKIRGDVDLKGGLK
jgi:hypothetical protein